jgi:hypothetical protein
VIETGAVVGDQAQVGSGLGEEPRVDAVGDRRHQDVGLAHGAGEFLGGHRVIVGVEGDVEKLLHPGLDRHGKTPRDDDAHSGRRHAISCFEKLGLSL